MFRGRVGMCRLIIKENMRSKGLEDRALADAAEEKGLVDPDDFILWRYYIMFPFGLP